MTPPELFLLAVMLIAGTALNGGLAWVVLRFRA